MTQTSTKLVKAADRVWNWVLCESLGGIVANGHGCSTRLEATVAAGRAKQEYLNRIAIACSNPKPSRNALINSRLPSFFGNRQNQNNPAPRRISSEGGNFALGKGNANIKDD